MTEAEYIAKRAALLDQLTGPQQVQYGDRSVTNRPLRDIQAAISALDSEWQRQQGTGSSRVGRFYISGEGL